MQYGYCISCSLELHRFVKSSLLYFFCHPETVCSILIRQRPPWISRLHNSSKMLSLLGICLLLSSISAQVPDYCDIEPRTCANHVFDVSSATSGNTFTCKIQPLAYNSTTGSFEPSGAEYDVAPTSVSDTEVECTLTSIQAAEVRLKGTQSGILAEVGFIYPEMCFTCTSMDSCARKFRWYELRGCYINEICYPSSILNPADASTTCYAGYNSNAWIPIPAAYGGAYAILFDVCLFNESFNFIGFDYTAGVKRAIAPGGVEALDYTTPGVKFLLPEFTFDSLSYSFSLKFYVKFDREPIKDTITFFDIPRAMELQRRPDGAIIINYNFLDFAGNQYPKTAVIQKTEDKPKANGDNSIQTKDWLLIGLDYEMRSGQAKFNWFLDGEEITADLGDLTGLYLRTTESWVLQNSAISCLEVGDAPMGSEYHGIVALENCESFYAGQPEGKYDKCEEVYMTDGVRTQGTI